MEMMIVLLIVAVIAAASAPLVTKKMSSTGGTLDSSPWVYTGIAKSIAYNMDGSASSAIIGASKVPNGSTPKLYIESSGNEAQIGFGRAGSNDVISLTMDTVNKRIGFSSSNITPGSIFFGINNISASQQITNSILIGNGIEVTRDYVTSSNVIIGNDAKGNSTGSTLGVAIGNQAITGNYGVSIGHSAEASGPNSIAIGGNLFNHRTEATQYASIAVGASSKATGSKAIAIGGDTKAVKGSIALGFGAEANFENSMAIGGNSSKPVKTTSANQVVIGTEDDTVYIPGNLVVGGNTLLGLNTGAFTVFRNGSTGAYQPTGYQYENGGRLLEIHAAANKTVGGFTLSDRRLKNIGDKFTAGVNELSKLDFFHYTFKKDKTKTPHVGVIAQDLQKVFPDAVTKGDDGFLRIRWEEMFYAAINAIKELNTKITEIADNLMNTNSKIEEQDRIIKEQQKTIDELIKRIDKLEKAQKKA